MNPFLRWQSFRRLAQLLQSNPESAGRRWQNQFLSDNGAGLDANSSYGDISSGGEFCVQFA
jgi:hypothetical protein